MQADEFNNVLHYYLEKCEQILGVKAAEYATEDRLHNFKVAAALEGCTPRQALAGFMAKHTVSIYDMCRAPENTFSDGQWDEKIVDHLNYLILLAALVKEEKNDRTEDGNKLELY